MKRLIPALSLVAALATPAAAQSTQSTAEAANWRFSASIYAYLPSVGGQSSVPADTGGTPINVDNKQLIDALKMTFMGALGAHNGSWGVFTDLMYLNLGGGKHNSRDFTIGNVGLPVGTTANLDLDLKGVIWTLGGDYRLQSKPGFTLDMLAGARLLDIRQTLSWSITGDLGPLQPSGRTGTAEADIHPWDGIVGLKGRASFGDAHRWSVPFYVDVGTGQSDLTWQMAGGIGYRFAWGEMTAMWRYLAYEMKSGQGLERLNFNGPVVGAIFRW